MGYRSFAGLHVLAALNLLVPIDTPGWREEMRV